MLKSKWWAKGGDHSAHLADIERRLLETAERLGDAAYRVHFDEYVADPSVLAPMFAWLGEEYDAAEVRATMERKHSV